MRKPEIFQGGDYQWGDPVGGMPYRLVHASLNIGMILIGSKITGLENIERIRGKDNGILIVSNHQSLWDIPLQTRLGLGPLGFMGKEKLWNYMPIRGAAKLAGAFPVNRSDRESGRRAIDIAITKLNRGEVVSMYPEGTRDPGRHQNKYGAAVIASSAEGETDVVPINVEYRRTSKGKVSPIGAGVAVGEPFVVEKGDDVETVGQRIFASIDALQPTAYELAHTRLPTA